MTVPPISMPTAPPYAPVQEPPWMDQFPPPPPVAPPEASPHPQPPHRRGRGVALIVAMSILCAGIGLELGGAVFGSSRPAVTATKVDNSPLPTVGTTPSAGATPSTALTTDAIAAQVDPAIVDINTTLDGGRAAGTGMVLTSSGLVLTNNHVIADANDISVQITGSGDTYSATVLGYDISDDVALIQLDGASNLATINVGDSSTVAVRDRVIALGNALGKGGTPAVAEGAVTALDQTIAAGDFVGGPRQTLTDLIEISAPLVPGDSGGALVNTSGQVIGMNAAASQTGNGRPTNDAYAIPINKALDIAHQIQAGQSSDKVHIGARALLGVQVQDAQGAAVAAVQSGSPADKAGMVAGDVIVSVGDATITSLSDLPTALDQYHPGDKVSIGWVDANGKHHTAIVQLIAGPPA